MCTPIPLLRFPLHLGWLGHQSVRALFLSHVQLRIDFIHHQHNATCFPCACARDCHVVWYVSCSLARKCRGTNAATLLVSDASAANSICTAYKSCYQNGGIKKCDPSKSVCPPCISEGIFSYSCYVKGDDGKCPQDTTYCPRKSHFLGR